MMSVEFIKTLDFWIMFLTLLCMGTVISFQLPSNLLEIIIILLCLYSIRTKGGVFPREMILMLLFLWIYMFLGSLFTGTPLIKYMGLYLRTFLAILIVSVFKKNVQRIENAVYWVLWVLTFHGFLNFFAMTFLPMFFHGIVIGDAYGTYTLGYVFYKQYESGFAEFVRNPGLFWEPGLYQFSVNILLFLILIIKKKSFSFAFIPIFVILTTVSTTGYLIMVIIVLYRIFIINKVRLSFKKLLLILMALTILLPMVLLNMQDKLAGESAGSSGARLYDLYFGLKLTIENPWFGIGFDFEKYEDMMYDISLGSFYDSVYEFGHHSGNTNTIVSIFMCLGIPIGVIYLYGLYHQKIFKYHKLFFLVVSLSIFSEPLTSVTFIWLFILSSSLKGIRFNTNKCKCVN